MNENTSMIDVSLEEAEQTNGGFSWCAAFFVGAGAAIGAGLTDGVGTLEGAKLGAIAAAVIC